MCASTPSAVPAIACIPTKSAASTPLSRILGVLGPLVLDDVFAVGIELVGDEGVERPALPRAVAVHDDDLGRAGGLRAADGRVDLAGVEAPAFLEHRVTAGDLLPPDDAGDAFHVGDDEDLHDVAQAYDADDLAARVGDRRLEERVDARAAGRAPGRCARYAPSSTLRAMPRPSSDAAQKSPSAPPFAIHPPRRIRSVSTAPLEPPTSSGLACIAARIRGGRAREQGGGLAQGGGERGDAAAVDADLAVRGDQLGDALLQRMRRIAVGVQRPPVRRDRRRASPRACPSSCCRASRRAGPPAARSRGRRSRPRPAPAPCGLRRAAPARRGGRRTRSRARRRRGRRTPRETGSPGSASTTSAGSRPARGRRSSRRRSSRRARGAPPRRSPPRRTSTMIGSTCVPKQSYIRRLSASTSSTNGLVTLYGP